MSFNQNFVVATLQICCIKALQTHFHASMNFSLRTLFVLLLSLHFSQRQHTHKHTCRSLVARSASVQLFVVLVVAGRQASAVFVFASTTNSRAGRVLLRLLAATSAQVCRRPCHLAPRKTHTCVAFCWRMLITK